jgi:hypothetical protein
VTKVCRFFSFVSPNQDKHQEACCNHQCATETDQFNGHRFLLSDLFRVLDEASIVLSRPAAPVCLATSASSAILLRRTIHSRARAGIGSQEAALALKWLTGGWLLSSAILAFSAVFSTFYSYYPPFCGGHNPETKLAGMKTY